MPNWCEGKLKIRGKKENIVKFIKDGTKLLEGFFEVKEIVPDVLINEYEELEIKNYDQEKRIDTLWIIGTHRNFIELYSKDIYIRHFDEEESIICVDFKSAWFINTDDLISISELYSIDFKIYAFERGMEFNQDIEIIKGKIIKDEEIKFNDYMWECVNPMLGG